MEDAVPEVQDVFWQDGEFNQDAYELFLLGNQGPDPLLFAQFTSNFFAIKEFGSRLHRERADETIESFMRIACSMPQPQRTLLSAYLWGFICHFVLDSVVHPLVYAQQNALCDAGVRGLDRRDGPTVHAQIEADLDMMVLWQRTGMSIRELDYTPFVLRASDEALALLDRAYVAMAHEVFGHALPEHAFAKGLRDMRWTIRVLYSPRGIKRCLIGKAERLFTRHSFAQAMSPCNHIGATCDFDNRMGEPWVNPASGVVVTASFAQLYGQALEAAIANIHAVLEGKPVSEITAGLNFRGER